ncbi:MAG TPA: primosomal protein N' [Polyangiaceae bacterium]|nr:primosomal protein N' [Polyangiaceae bacterium]
MRLAKVAVPVPLGQAFTYAVPAELSHEVQPGARVLVEFGRRRVLAVVLQAYDGEPDFDPKKLKPLAAVVDAEPVFPLELLEFLVELARYYLAPLGEVMRLALPAVERSVKARLSSDGVQGAAEIATVGRMVRWAAAVDPEPAGPIPRGQGREILAYLRASGPQAVAELAQRWSNARPALKRLEASGQVTFEERPGDTDPFFSEPLPSDVAPELTPAQRLALDRVQHALATGGAKSFLLQGVTGSGKTEVYLRTVGQVAQAGGGCIVLVPEIALTPQLVSRFRARLGDDIAVLHSGLTESERHQMWRSLRSGKVRIAIGARSALFAPVQNLALICVDEEHDGSFKQEEGVRYNARDMALLRAHRAGALCLLGSATPSVASEALVRKQKLERLVLPDRADHAARLPKVEIVDLRRVGAGPSGHRLLSLTLHRALERTLEAKEQAILFLNRRGFAITLLCSSCGKLSECPNCAVSLTLHRRGGEALRCHYCDYAIPVPTQCPSCHSDRLSEEGAGTERIESALSEAFPNARIGRLDRDVAAGAKSERILNQMRAKELDVLVGTQMVTKGHDLPEVTLVGVLNADSALSLPDFRAAERTFQLLVQVAGRAGRGDRPGTVLIQTYQPEHPAVVLAARHDVTAFLDREIEARRELRYPPFSRLALVRVDAVDEREAERAAAFLADIAARACKHEADILGPAPAPLIRLRNRFRYRFMVRSASRAPLRAALLAVARAPDNRRVRVAIDVDPMSML